MREEEEEPDKLVMGWRCCGATNITGTTRP